MSITDELREWTRTNTVNCSDNRIALVGIAERIDAEHKRMYADLTVGMEPMTEESMAEHGWVKLPKDADGVPIRIGDALEGYGKTIEIEELRNDGTWHLVDVYGIEWDCHEAFAHVQPDSWERIIEDACDMTVRCCDDDAGKAELVERCKRLAGEGA